MIRKFTFLIGLFTTLVLPATEPDSYIVRFLGKSETSCKSVESVIEKAYLVGIDLSHVNPDNFRGFTIGGDGKCDAFDKAVIFMPKTPGDIPYVKNWVSSHQDLVIFDTMRRIEPVKKFQVTLALKSYLCTSSQNCSSISEKSKTLEIPSYQEVLLLQQHYLELQAKSMSYNFNEALKVIATLFNSDIAENLRRDIWPQANYFRPEFDIHILSEDSGYWIRGMAANAVCNFQAFPNCRLL